MCGGKLCPFLANLATYNRCVLAANGHIVNRNEPTMVCGGNICQFLTKLVTYNRCVVAIKDLILIRN